MALAWPATGIARFAVLTHLGDVAAHRLPALDLAFILMGEPSSQVVAAVPLEPAAGILGVNPAFGYPDFVGLAGGNSEKVEVAVRFVR